MNLAQRLAEVAWIAAKYRTLMLLDRLGVASARRWAGVVAVELVASIAPLPSKLDPVEKDQAYSSSTSIMVRWATPSDQEPIIGYRL